MAGRSIGLKDFPSEHSPELCFVPKCEAADDWLEIHLASSSKPQGDLHSTLGQQSQSSLQRLLRTSHSFGLLRAAITTR